MKSKPHRHKFSDKAVMTQAEVAARFGVRPQSIQGVEYRALRKLRTAIQREAEAAGVSVRDWLFGES